MSCRSTNAPQTTTFLCYRSFINSSPLQLSKYTIPKTAISVKPKAGNRESATSAGNQHVLALDSNHNVWAWGKNYYGQLGNGSVVDSSTQVKVQKKNWSGTTYRPHSYCLYKCRL
jgi:alpha-tubulin suppressor-like RCC1 family protein